jgi:MoaA/NifB/PqqE/SkfB family radical SAM enzyme
LNASVEEKIYPGISEKCISVEVTTLCNSACSHCFARAGISTPSSLPIDLVKEIIAEGYNAAYRQLHITGGEPLLWEGLFEVLDYVSELGYQTVFLNTNGKLLSEDVNSKLSAYDGLSVSVSLEGPKSLHDRIRGEGSYKWTMKSIEKVLDSSVDLFIFTTASKSLLPDLPYFADDIYKKFPDIKYLIFIQLIRVTDDVFDLSNELLDPDDFLQLIRFVSLLNLCGFKTQVLNNPLARVVSIMLKMPWIPQVHPPYGDGSIIVMANRDITLFHSNRDSLGKYEPGMIERVLASDQYQNAIAPDIATCPSCKYAELCRENGMVRPSQWYRDMHPEVPYCKRVLDRAVSQLHKCV